MDYFKFGFFASRNGSTMQAIIDALKTGFLKGEGSVFITNNKNCYAKQRAIENNIPSFVINSKQFKDVDKCDESICKILKDHDVNIVILAGYMKKIGSITCKNFKNHILNIHPSLLPKYGGEGMYGENVYESVLNAGELITGVSVHLVDEIYDHGRVISQKMIPIATFDTIESLTEKTKEIESKFYVEVLSKIQNGEIEL